MANRIVAGPPGAPVEGDTGGAVSGDRAWRWWGPWDGFVCFASDGEQAEFVETGGSYGDGLVFPDVGAVLCDVITGVDLLAQPKVAGAPHSGYARDDMIPIPLTRSFNNKTMTGQDRFYWFADITAQTVHVRFCGCGAATDVLNRAIMQGGEDTDPNSGRLVFFVPAYWDYFIFVKGFYT